MQINIDFHAMLELFNMIRQLTLHKIIEKDPNAGLSRVADSNIVCTISQL